MRTILLAAALALAAAGCDDTADCPAAVSAGASCTSAGLTCFAGASQCTCSGGAWSCASADMSVHIIDSGPHPEHDLAQPTD
jgi:hypothetical protein